MLVHDPAKTLTIEAGGDKVDNYDYSRRETTSTRSGGSAPQPPLDDNPSRQRAADPGRWPRPLVSVAIASSPSSP